MRRIKSASCSNNDRIICVTSHNKHDFYYQPQGTKNRYWLTDCRYNGSVYAYFRNRGINMGKRTFSLTIREFYKFRDHKNVKLANTLNQVLGFVDYVIRECIQDCAVRKSPAAAQSRRCVRSDDWEYELAG